MSAPDRLAGFHAIAFSSVDLAAAADHVRSLLGATLEIPEEDAEHHPQIHWVAPEKQSIGRAQMTAVLHELMLTSSGGSQRYVVIERAHELTPEAANALLKTLEEPPEAVSFYLTTPSAARLLPTIRSRVAVQSVSSEEHALDADTQSQLAGFIDGDVPERFASIARLQAEGQLQQFIGDLTETLRQRHEYAILEWMQLHHLSKSAPNHRLFLEALAASEVLG
jgi:DNA polymerase III delta prime subunit